MQVSKYIRSLLLLIFINGSIAANILGIFTSTGPSHLILHMATAKALAEAGHNVTVITTLPLKEESPKYHHVYVPPSEEDLTEWLQLISDAATGANTWETIKSMFQSQVQRVRIQAKALKHPHFQELLNNNGNHFDLVILGIVFNTFQLGVAAHFKCPVIINWINLPSESLLEYVGNPLAVSSAPVLLSDSNMLSFGNRVRNILLAGFLRSIEMFSDYKMEQYYDEFFPSERYPSYEEMKKNISLVFCASHFSEGTIRPLVPAFIETGGIQVKDKPDPLPQDIAEFLETPNDGFILFSLGTNVKTYDLSSNTTSAMFRVLSDGKYKVLWKWDSVETPGNSSNIMFRKWFPQDDLLMHPKLKLFITHAGKGSAVEAQFHGVPMLAIPIIGDQPAIARKIQSMGYGLTLDHQTLTADSFRKQLNEVLTNSTYQAAISKFSKLYRDRPMTPRQTVVYWTEYVIRHHGAKHMQSPAVHLNLLQKNSLDVLGFLGLSLFLLILVIRKIFKFLIQLVYTRKLKYD